MTRSPTREERAKANYRQFPIDRSQIARWTKSSWHVGTVDGQLVRWILLA